jgi:hypothetical protein
MNQPRDPDLIISMWLDDGPIDLPVETRRTIEVALRTQSRVRRMAFPGGITMLPLSRLATAAAIVVAVGAVSLLVFSNRNVGVTGPGPTPPASAPASHSFSPTASPSTDPLDTSAWVTYTSARYGFDIGHPTSWTERPATRAWSFDLDSDVNAPTSPGADHFTSSDGNVRVSAWDVPLESGVDLDSREQLLTWINDYCTRTGTAGCAGIRDRAVFFCNERRDCHNAYLVPFDDWIGTFAWGGSIDGVRIVAVWRSENDPQVAPYGGARALLDAFLSTMNIVPPTGDQLGGSPLPSPS